MKLKKRISCLMLVACFFSSQAIATNEIILKDDNFIKSVYNDFKFKVSDTWYNNNNKDFYLPLITWHNRWTYDKEKTDNYNERPWGAGYGVSKYDQKGNWNSIYIMAFKDSNNAWQPIGGFAWEKTWRPIEKDQDFKLGVGYTAVITARNDWLHYKVPVVGVLPLASIGYKDLSFQSTYVLGTYNNGNVWFGWLRYQF